MADRLRVEDTVKRVLDANLQCYEGLARVTAEYVQALGRVWVDAVAPVLGRAAASATTAPQSSSSPASPSAALVLEAEAGQIAQGVVMVENRLPRRVSATVITSAFSSGAGEEIWPSLRVQPGTITLESGARALVQIGVLVDDRLIAGVQYRGQVTVPGLSDTPIPVVLLRRASEPGAPPAARTPDQTPVEPTPRRRRVKRRQPG